MSQIEANAKAMADYVESNPPPGNARVARESPFGQMEGEPDDVVIYWDAGTSPDCYFRYLSAEQRAEFGASGVGETFGDATSNLFADPEILAWISRATEFAKALPRDESTD